MNRRFAVLSAAALLMAGAAQAQSVQTRSITVKFGDLNLSSPSGRQALDQRIQRAIWYVCGDRPSPVELDKRPDWMACRTAASDNAHQKLAEILKGEQLAESSIEIDGRKH